MEDMNVFGTKREISISMKNNIESVLGLSSRDKVTILLNDRCAKLKEVIKLKEDRVLHDIFPLVSEDACVIQVSIESTSRQPCKSWFLQLAGPNYSAGSLAFVTDDLLEVGITNLEQVVDKLNSLFPGIDFMLDK